MLTRPLMLWALFILFMGLVLGAMGWVSLTVIRLDRDNFEAGLQAEQEESRRLALWRMDSAVAPIIGRESVRPWFLYGASVADVSGFAIVSGLGGQSSRVSSALMGGTPEFILLHFQYDQEGDLSSPQVPSEYIGKSVDPAIVNLEQAKHFQQCLKDLAARLTLQKVTAALRQAREDSRTYAGIVSRGPLQEDAASRKRDVSAIQAKPSIADLNNQAVNPNSKLYQFRRNDAENTARQQAILYNGENWSRQTSTGRKLKNRVIPDPARSKEAETADFDIYENMAAPGSPIVREDIMRPLWVEGDLLLVREVMVDEQRLIQGCVLDWEALREHLLAGIADILPQASLHPQPGAAESGQHVLAGLPVRLTAVYTPPEDISVSSPVRTALILAWAGVLAAGIAVASLLKGTVNLSERRGAFVSAVTHELRTPLTTFRMYSEMLAEGMVTDETKRENYLKRLCSEADRLTHLVENVLSFARLEKGRAAHHLESMDLHLLLDRIRKRLEDRAREAGMTCSFPSGKDPVPVRADMTAVEQILFNLVDNASKYASAGDHPAVRIEIQPGPETIAICLCDNGPGINPEEANRLFKPFRKSARDAAHSAPGVGLGLALSRRLAREMGGDLTVDTAVEKGACFVLTLPRSRVEEA